MNDRIPALAEEKKRITNNVLFCLFLLVITVASAIAALHFEGTIFPVSGIHKTCWHALFYVVGLIYLCLEAVLCFSLKGYLQSCRVENLVLRGDYVSALKLMENDGRLKRPPQGLEDFIFKLRHAQIALEAKEYSLAERQLNHLQDYFDISHRFLNRHNNNNNNNNAPVVKLKTAQLKSQLYKEEKPQIPLDDSPITDIENQVKIELQRLKRLRDG